MSTPATPASPTATAQQFASDNYSGICPEAWAAMQEANASHALPYGDDDWTHQAADAFRALFETECEVFFAFNGTAANSLSLAALCQSYHSVICSDVAHVETDECGAPEFFSNGSKLLTVKSSNGKLTPEAIAAAWDEEIARRVAQLEAGEVETVPAEQVLAELRARLK